MEELASALGGSQRDREQAVKRSRATKAPPEPIEPHELAGELTHEQRVALADGLVALYRRKVAEDEQKKAQEAVEG